MGRTPLKRELIKDEKKRKLMFEQRKKSLLKKADELSSLCDVKVGVLIYGMNPDNETVVWHSSKSDDIEELIRLYKAQPFDQKKKRTTVSSIILEDQMRKSKSELSKLQEENNKARYPTWDKTYDELSEEVLREHARLLDAKIEQVNARYEYLQGNQLVCVDNLEVIQDIPLPLDPSEFSVSNFNLQPLDEFDFPVSNFNIQPSDEFDSSVSDYTIMNDNNMTMTNLMNNACSTNDYYIPQITDSSYFSSGNQFGFDPAMYNGAALMHYNDGQQYNTGGDLDAYF